VNPKEFVKYECPNEKCPPKCIIAYQSSTLDHFRRICKPTSKIELHNDLIIWQYKDIGFVRTPGIGSSNAVACLEELIALGGKVFITIGSAGGLNKEGTFLCDKALIDEGTSIHYAPSSIFSYPDKKLTLKLGESMKNLDISYSKGATWTTDAPYRETNRDIKACAEMGICTVDMEASALFTVAKFRKVKIASAFLIGDVYTDKEWKPKFKEKHIKLKLNKLVDAAICAVQT
jgi:uridine phosphorylase